jgi:hypothetical protein
MYGNNYTDNIASKWHSFAYEEGYYLYEPVL